MHSKLELTFAYRRGQTRLKDVQADSVFKVTRPVSLPDGSGLQLILMSPAPGIFGGDLWEIHIHAESGTQVHLTTQGHCASIPLRIVTLPSKSYITPYKLKQI